MTSEEPRVPPPPGEPGRRQVSIFLVGPARQQVEALRRRWDPETAARISAHVTVVYDDEAPDTTLLTERLQEAAGQVGPFWLGLGGAGSFLLEDRTVYVEVSSGEAEVLRLREIILRPPFAPRRRFTPHVTLVRRATGKRADAAWEGLRGVRIDTASAADRLTLVENRGGVWLPLADFPLSGGPPLARPELAWPPAPGAQNPLERYG